MKDIGYNVFTYYLVVSCETLKRRQDIPISSLNMLFMWAQYCAQILEVQSKIENISVQNICSVTSNSFTFVTSYSFFFFKPYYDVYKNLFVQFYAIYKKNTKERLWQIQKLYFPYGKDIILCCKIYRCPLTWSQEKSTGMPQNMCWRPM